MRDAGKVHALNAPRSCSSWPSLSATLRGRIEDRYDHCMRSHLVLASASPQRKTLLEGLGLSFTVVPSGIDESTIAENDPARRALLLAHLKAKDVASQRPDAFIIGCDTLVVTSGGKLLEKPQNASEARMMLALQSGNVSVVHSGLCVVAPDGRSFDGVSSSAVTFKVLSADELDWWIATGLWQGRSGAFQIDGQGQLMIEKVEGDWTGIVGLPVFLLGKLLEEVGCDWKCRMENGE